MNKLLFSLLFLLSCSFPIRKDWIIIENFNSEPKCYYLSHTQIFLTKDSLFWYNKHHKKEIKEYKVYVLNDYQNLNLIENELNLSLKECKPGNSIY